VIGIHRTGNNRFSQAGARVNDGLTPPTRYRIRGKENTRDFGIDHSLDDDGELHGSLVDAVGSSVDNGAVAPQRSPASADRIQHSGGADYMQVGILLAGEAGARVDLRRLPKNVLLRERWLRVLRRPW